MVENIIGVTLALIAGFLVALLNFQISKKVLEKKPEMYISASTMRLVLTIVFLVVMYLFAEKTLEESTYALIGGVLGVTLPGFYFTSRLLKLNASLENKKKEGENADG